MDIRTQDATAFQTRTAPSILNAQLAYHELGIVNRREMLRVLDEAAHDPEFLSDILDKGSVALRTYELSQPEKAALVTGDIGWIEEHLGKLTDTQCTLLNCVLHREAW